MFFGILVSLLVLNCGLVYAFDIVPQFVSMVQTNTVGIYKAPNSIKLYLEPDETSKLIDVITWSKDGIDPNTINAQVICGLSSGGK